MFPISRRLLGQALLAAGLVRPAVAAEKTTLLIGLDIGDTITLDPARQSNYTPPMTLAAVYDRLVTITPGHYDTVAPALAMVWEQLEDGRVWRFTLDPAATFASGNKVTPEDCRFSLNRVLTLGDAPAQFLSMVASVEASGTDTVDIRLKVPNAPILQTLAAPEYGILERAIAVARGASERGGDEDDATEWLNQNSAGSGAYVLNGWARLQYIQLVANPRAWRDQPGFQRIVIRHIPNPVAQLRALERGDIDVAFNLIPEQVAALSRSKDIRIDSTTSLDFVYLALNGDKSLNPALADDRARQAIGWAIDYDALVSKLLGGKAVRPASFLPIGLPGSTDQTTSEVGFHQDLDKSRALLGQAGLSGGFEVELSYADTAIAGLSYSTLARQLQSDLGRVGIKLKLRALNPATLRSDFAAGKAQAVLAFWNAPVVEERDWAQASIERVAPRVGFHPSPELLLLVDDASTAELDSDERGALWVEYQKAMVEAANLIVLFQPMYQVAVRRSVAAFPLTGAGWMADLGRAHPA